MFSSEIAIPEIRQQLARVLEQDLFAGSPRMARFLRFVVEEVLASRGAQIKEVVVGAQVFDRDPAYDPRLDPIVRVEARRLRLKLRAYYEGPGSSDRVILELPKGQYAPVIREREAAAALKCDATIAVLPFANLTAEGESQYFSDGLTDELIHALTGISELCIVGWDSAL